MSDLAKHLHLTEWQVNNGYGIMHFAVATYFGHVHEYDAAVFFMAYGVYVTANWLFMMNVAAMEHKAEFDDERRKTERLNAKKERETHQKYDAFFAVNGYPHQNDAIGVAAWGAKQGWSPQETPGLLMAHDGKQCSAERRQRPLIRIRDHGWQVTYVALAFTPLQRSGEDHRPLHGMIWKNENEKYFLNLEDMIEFGKEDCSPKFPLKERCIPQHTFSIEKEQSREWDDVKKVWYWMNID